jgi:hypothetical protein
VPPAELRRAELAAVLLVELEHADLCERQRFGGLPRLAERAVHRNVVLLILVSLIEIEHADLCERQRFGGLPGLVGRAVHRNVALLVLASLYER